MFLESLRLRVFEFKNPLHRTKDVRVSGTDSTVQFSEIREICGGFRRRLNSYPPLVSPGGR